jgi:hypothetical protein
MQFILTEAELTELHDKARNARAADTKKLQAFCTRVANELPVNWGWGDEEHPDPKPWGCILSTKEEWYCDTCPAQKVCPHKAKKWCK